MKAYFLQQCILSVTSSYNIILSIMISSSFNISCLQKSPQLYFYYFTPFSITYYSFCRSSAKSFYLLHLFPCCVFSDSKYYHLLFHTGILHNQGYPLQIIFHCCRSYYDKQNHWLLYILKILLLSLLQDPFSVLRIFYLSFSLHYYSCSLCYNRHTVPFAGVTTGPIDICSHRITTSLLTFAHRNDSNRYLNVNITLNWPW